METFLFWVFAIVGVGCGVMVVFHRNPMSSAIYLVVTMLCLAGFYALLGGPFVAVIQVLVYAGAVMVLMLFVIMMLNLRAGPCSAKAVHSAWLVAGLIGSGAGAVCRALGSVQPAALPAAADGFGTIEDVGSKLFRSLLPFELTSVLLHRHHRGGDPGQTAYPARSCGVKPYDPYCHY